jgi:hypothetical protein
VALIARDDHGQINAGINALFLLSAECAARSASSAAIT